MNLATIISSGCHCDLLNGFTCGIHKESDELREELRELVVELQEIARELRTTNALRGSQVDSVANRFALKLTL